MVEIKGVPFNPEAVRKMSKSAFVKIVESMKDSSNGRAKWPQSMDGEEVYDQLQKELGIYKEPIDKPKKKSKKDK
jgi:DNA polymerase III delta prime subunit